MELFLNIYFYNFRLLHQILRKLLVVYLNPFVWISNFSKTNLGYKLFFEHMEKNFPTFLNYYRNEFRTKLFFIPFLSNAQLDFSNNKKFTKADSLRGTLSSLRSCYDVLMYDLDIKVDIENKFISGSNTIKFISVNDFQKIHHSQYRYRNCLEKLAQT